MKEITRIHLAQVPYNIELAAKKDLEKYLVAIEKSLDTDADTLREIEARIGELLAERGVMVEKVITTHDVAEIKARLGEPGEFADEPQLTADTKKRFMRDESKGMLGGVLSGLAAYTNVDVVWYRIAAIVLALVSFGTAVLLYVVLWIVVPPARTAAERLHMRGATPNLENIQEEAAMESAQRPTSRKPFVVLLRMLGVLAFAGAACGALALVVFALVAGIPMMGTYDWLINGWLVATMILLVISGVLFALLMGLCGYSVGMWRMSKSLVIAAVIVTAMGLVSFATSIGLGVYGGQQLQANVESHTKVTRMALPQLKQAQSVTVRMASEQWVSAKYRVTEAEPYAEARVLGRQNETIRLPIQIMREGNVVTIQLDTRQETPTAGRCYGLWDCQSMLRELVIYGPAVDTFRAQGGSVAYETKQATLHAEAGDGATLTIVGTVASLDVSTASQGSILADGAAIDHVRLAVDQGTTAHFGTMQSLAITVPSSCGSQTENNITYSNAQTVTVNGAPWQTEGTRQPACATIEHDGDTESPSMVY